MAVTRIWDADNGVWQIVGGTVPIVGGGGGGGGGGSYLPLAGGTLTGPLILSANPTAALGAATKQYVDGQVGGVGFLPLSGGTMTGALVLAGPPATGLEAATKTYVDGATVAKAIQLNTPRHISLTGDVTGTTSVAFDGTAAVSIATTIAGTGHSHSTQYAALSHTHSEYAPTHSHPYSASSHNHDTVYLQDSGTDTMSGTLYVATLLVNGLGPNELWAYNNVNGSIRWMGVGVGVGQSHGSSSETYKTEISEIDLSKSVFSRLKPIWFRYREDFEFKDRYGDSWDSFENPPLGRMGFTYEQVKEVAPHWAYEADETLAVSYEGMLPDFMAWALAAINDLQAKVTGLQAQLEGS